MENFQKEQFFKKLNEFDEKLNKLEFNLNNSDDHIKEECLELRRLIQLNKEETIAQIKESNGIDVNAESLHPDLLVSIDKATHSNEKMLDQIDNYESKILLMSQNYDLASKQKLIKDIRKLKQISKYFIKYWKTSLAESNETDAAKLKNAFNKLNDYHGRLVDLIKEADYFIFCNLLIKLKQASELDESLSLYFVQDFKFDCMNQRNLKHLEKKAFEKNKTNFLNETVRYHCDVFDDGAYVIASRIGENLKDATVVIYDPRGNRVKKQKLLFNLKILDLKADKTEIILKAINSSDELYARGDHIILMMNFSLEIIKYKFFYEMVRISDCSPYRIYSYDGEKAITIYDLCFNQLRTIKFQCFDELAPFYSKSLLWKFEAKFDMLIIGCTAQDFVYVLDTKGYLHCRIPSKQNNFNIDLNGNLTIINNEEKKLTYYDLNGNLIRIIDFYSVNSNLGTRSVEAIFDSKSRLILYNFLNLEIFEEKL